MASPFHCLLLLCSLLFFISPSSAVISFRPQTIVLPVFKDKCTNQYTIHINQRTPSVPVNLTVDLGGRFMWVNCEEGFVSSSYKPVSCDSRFCSVAGSQGCVINPDCKPRPGCYNNTCNQFTENRVLNIGTGGELGRDVASFQFYSEKYPGRIVSVPDFPFVCGSTWLVQNLADGVTGIAGLGRSNISLPYYLSHFFGFPNKFAICLSPSPKTNGLVFFGNGPSTNILTYTPLIFNPVDNLGNGQSDYYIGLKSIKVGGKMIKFDKNLLPITKDGSGGARISTVSPYTVLQTSIYKSLIKAFNKTLGTTFYTAVVPSQPVPFDLCYLSGAASSTEDFLSHMPVIDLELEDGKGGSVYWSILGANSMVPVDSFTVCLAFVDGGPYVWTPVVIGGRQMEDNLLQFDVANSRFGFSSNLLTRNSSCSNFVNSKLA